MENKFTCEWSGLHIAERTFFPGKRAKNGVFADVNCALAYLQHHKPRNWQAKVAAIKTAVGRTDVHLAAKEGWSLEDPRRVICPALQQHYDEWLAHERRLQTRRKRPREEPAPAADGQQQWRVEIMDIDAQGRFKHPTPYFTSNWRALLSSLQYKSDHAMPAQFTQCNEFVLYPLLAADPQFLKATQCNVRVTRLR